MLGKIRSKIIHSKVFMLRTMSYVGIFNSVMLLFLTLSRFENYGINIDIRVWFIPIVIGIIFTLITIGFLEDKLGFYKAEISMSVKRNKGFTEVNNRLDNIEKMIKEMK